MDVQNRKMTRGDTYAFDHFAKKPDPTTGILVPVDLTGGRAWFTAKRSITDVDVNAIVKVSTVADDVFGLGITVINAAGGQIRVTIPAASTKVLPFNPVDLLYDIQVAESGGATTTSQSGVLTVSPDVTLAVP